MFETLLCLLKNLFTLLGRPQLPVNFSRLQLELPSRKQPTPIVQEPRFSKFHSTPPSTLKKALLARVQGLAGMAPPGLAAASTRGRGVVGTSTAATWTLRRGSLPPPGLIAVARRRDSP